MGTMTRSQKALADGRRPRRRNGGAPRSRSAPAASESTCCATSDLPALAPATPREVLDGLTEFDATFPARDARAVALERSAGAPIQACARAASRAPRPRGDPPARRRDRHHPPASRPRTDGRGDRRTTRRRPQWNRSPRPWPPAKPTGSTRSSPVAGGRLSDEQRAAIALACGTCPLVIIEGHAGTGKSTTLTGIARAHQAAGQQILVTSTAALAAERLATELAEHGVRCQAYSTAGLHAAITTSASPSSPQTTIIHDEAALASTSEQLGLLDAVETAGARMIAVGDPKQNQPVGAGGLWDHIEQSTRTAGAHVELTHNQRARDPADRRDQALFRDGHAERAIRGYAARERIHLHDDPRRAEDQALDAAHADRAEGKTTTVIVQTSNDHLDALNARAQAIRYQAGELGNDSLPAPGRPYELRQGDLVQIRHTIQHPDHGPLRNGTTAEITADRPESPDTRAPARRRRRPDTHRAADRRR